MLGDRRWVVDACAEGVIEGDPDRLTQAMLELANNATKFSAPGSHGRRSALPWRPIRCGCGCATRAPGSLPRTSTGSSTGSSAATTSHAIDGSGLGALDRVGHRHRPRGPGGGRRRPGAGSDVHHRATAPADSWLASAQSSGQAPWTRPRRRRFAPGPDPGSAFMSRILVVEDEARISSFIAKGLRCSGFTPTVVADGRSGLRPRDDRGVRPDDPRHRAAPAGRVRGPGPAARDRAAACR